MSVALIVLLCGAAAALVAFTVSASRRIQVDPIDPAVEERAVGRALRGHPRIDRFLHERFDRRSAGGFLLTASFVILFVVAVFIGLMLNMISDHSGLAAADASVAKWGSENAGSTAARAMVWITQLGSTPVIIAVLLVTACVDYLRRRSREVFVFVIVVGLGELLVANALKDIVRRDRPPSVGRLVVAHGFSFPSGHTVAAAAAWSAVALVFGRDRSRRTRALLAAGAALIAVSVAASRALLGVHWLSDVIAGLAVGWGWFMIVAVVFGGRAQRLGDPVADQPHGEGVTTAAGVRADHALPTSR